MERMIFGSSFFIMGSIDLSETHDYQFLVSK